MKLYDISDWCKHGVELINYPYLGEIELDTDTYKFGMPIKVGTAVFTVGVLSAKKDKAGVRKAKFNSDPEEQNYEKNIKCPYCGYENSDSWECGDTDDEYECGRCRGVFSYERVVTVEYNSYPKTAPKTINAKWIKEQTT
jgi:transcription elongation factor Elf1